MPGISGCATGLPCFGAAVPKLVYITPGGESEARRRILTRIVQAVTTIKKELLHYENRTRKPF